MTNLAVLFAIAAAAGVAVALQGQTLGAMNRAAGTATAMFVTYGIGGAISGLLWLFRRPAGGGAASVPWHGWTAGALGLLIVGGIGYAAPRLGLTRTLVITVAAQLGASLAIEALGLWGATPRALDATKVAGVLLTALGVWLTLR